MTTELAILKIRIHKGKTEGYQVELRMDDSSPRPWIDFPSNTFSIDSSLPQQEFGRVIFQRMMENREFSEIWKRFQTQSPQRRIRLWISPNALELHNVPWEYMCESVEGSIYEICTGQHTPFSRELTSPHRFSHMTLPNPVHILVSIAAPKTLEENGLSAIDYDEELSALTQIFEPFNAKIEAIAPPVTLPRVREYLARTPGFHVFHHLGHARMTPDQGTVLLLEDNNRDIFYATSAEFGDIFKSLQFIPDVGRTTLAFLASCHSGTEGMARAYSGLAQNLMLSGIPAVVAMQGEVVPELVRTFSRTFYRELLDQGFVDLAANTARHAVKADGQVAYGAPVVFCRQANCRLFAFKKSTLLVELSEWKSIHVEFQRRLEVIDSAVSMMQYGFNLLRDLLDDSSVTSATRLNRGERLKKKQELIISISQSARFWQRGFLNIRTTVPLPMVQNGRYPDYETLCEIQQNSISVSHDLAKGYDIDLDIEADGKEIGKLHERMLNLRQHLWSLFDQVDSAILSIVNALLEEENV